jgi:hypothetical protein
LILERIAKDIAMKLRENVGRVAMILAGLWIVSNVAVPLWVGRSYTTDHANPAKLYRHGSFGLAGASGLTKYAPLWSPPVPHSTAIVPAVRWPWESAVGGYHVPGHSVEMVVSDVIFRISCGLVLLGFVARQLSPRDAAAVDRTCARILWRWAWTVLAACLIYIPTGLLCFSLEKDIAFENGMIVSFALLLSAVCVWTLRSDHRSVALRGFRSPAARLS